jgi:uncharacterized repeat protein (TIGR01451 family)
LISLRVLGAVCTLTMCIGLGSNKALAVGVPAGTDITNTAEVTYVVGTTSATASSNAVVVRVAEILDVVVTRQSPANTAVSASATQQEIVFTVTNAGNGPEAFRLVMDSVIGADDFDPTPGSPSIYFDTDASGDLSPGDTPYTAGTNDPLLNPDTSVTVLVVNDIPASVVNGNVGIARLTADARTGSGASGTVFAGQGAGGTDAVVGMSGALAGTTGQYQVAGVTVSAVKSQTVVDQFGGTRPLPTARINYTVTVQAVGTGSAANAVFNDNIPANTTYVAGTLRLNSSPLSDTAADDAGEFITTPSPHVRVTLGNLTQASGTQTIQFAVTIN